MAAKILLLCCSVVVSIHVSNSWLFKERTKNAVADVNDHCLQRADDGDCGFYTECLQARFPCRSRGFALKFGYPYCTALGSNYDKFNAEGQEWVTDVKKCLTQQLKATYEGETYTCKAIKKQGMSRISTCFRETNFCDIMWDNKEVLWSIFRIKDLTTLRLWRELLSVVGRCVGNTSKEFVGWIAKKISPIHG